MTKTEATKCSRCNFLLAIEHIIFSVYPLCNYLRRCLFGNVIVPLPKIFAEDANVPPAAIFAFCKEIGILEKFFLKLLNFNEI